MSVDPSPDTERPIRRAPVVYGKRLAHHSSPAAVLPADADAHEHSPAAPSSPRRPSPSGDERSPSPDAAGPFEFGFRQRLKELDERFDDHDAQRSPDRQAVPAGPSQPKDPESVSMGTAVLSPKARHPPGELSRTLLSPSPTLLHATQAQDHPLDSPPVHRRARRATNIVPSDSEAEEPGRSSSASPVRHAITTPHTRSSPTPPTSGEPMVSAKAKGKAPARDVLPLVFDAESPLAFEPPIKSKKTRQGESLGRSRTKAPTKKERREAAFESSRIAADRPVEVLRTQKQKHSLSAFFATLRRDNIVTPTSSTELPSDPIERFSSPNDKSTLAPPLNSMFGAPTGLLNMSAHVGTSDMRSPCKKNRMVPPIAFADSDDDDEMPSITSLVQQTSEKEQRLQAIKKVALQQVGTADSSEDEDLLVVKDDMHAVAREEAAQRRLDKAHGSPSKDKLLLRKIKHPSVRPVVVSPRKISKQELEELAKPSFARRGKDVKEQLNKKQLDQMMMIQHTKEQLRMIQQNEEEWVKKGGKLLRNIGGDVAETSLSQRLEAFAKQALKTADTGDVVEADVSADESDGDYVPDLRGSASPEPMNEGDSEPDDNMEVSQVPQSTVDDDGDEEEVAPSKRNKSGQRHPRLIVGSDDESEQPARHDLPNAQRESTSSMESQTEDENDKENSAKLMYDRSEDKENKAVVCHKLPSSESRFGSRLGYPPGSEVDARRSPSLAPVADLNDTMGSPTRSPLKDISKDEDDLFLSPSAKSSFTERLLRGATTSPPRASASTLGLGSPPTLRSERINRMNRLSLGSENDENDPSGFRPLQPSFLERLHSQAGLDPSLAPLNPLQNGGFSQLFSAEDGTLRKYGEGVENDGLALTLDVGLKPALEVSATLIRKAESIFEKEQEYVVAAAVQHNDKPKEVLYVNDHGFLTQTRPEGSSPQMYRTTPSQVSKFIGTQAHLTQTEPLSGRPPLRTLSFTASQELSPELQPLRRLHRRSPSPLEQKTLGRRSDSGVKLNAFSILGKVPKPPPNEQKEKHEKSEFVAVEAEESDEDDMFGFGGPKGDDDDNDDNEQDKVVEGLLDDRAMDAETEAADLVQERYREHEEEDDQRLQKLHQDAIEGKFRTKRRDRGVGFEDDSDDDDDDDARIRQRIYKKRKIEGDSLEALGQNEETRAFYNTYHQDLMDEDDEFRHLREESAMVTDHDDAQGEEPEEQDTVTVDEVRQRVREMAQNNTVVEVLNPEDTSWIDQSMIAEGDDTIHIRVVEHRRSRITARHPNAGPIDFDVERFNWSAQNDQEAKQLKAWAKNQGGQLHGTGRSGNSAAVTGHLKAKTGGGSLRRSKQLSNSASVSESRPKMIQKSASLLSSVSSRSGKFA